MRICVLAHSFPRNEKDVAAAFMKGLCDGFVEAGNEVVVVTPFDKNFNRSGDPFKIVTYKYIWPDALHLLGYSQTMEADIKLRKRAYFLLPFMLFFGTLALLKTVKKERVDVINVHWILPNGPMALIISKMTGVPYVVTLPGTDAYLARRFKVFGWVARLVANNAAGVLSNSSFILKRIMDLGVRNLPTGVISYPSDAVYLKPSRAGVETLRDKLGIARESFVILAVGRLVYKKGFEYLIKSMPVIVKKYPQTRLVIGGEGDLMSQLKELARNLKVSRQILFVGTINRDEILKYYNLADVLVAPSIVDKYGNVDGGPVVSFESMACGKPQIATDILGVADYIKDGVNGYKVPQKDSKAIAAAILKLMESKAVREKMGRVNRELIMDALNTKAIGVKYNEFIEKVI